MLQAVRFHPHGGQSDFVWHTARTAYGAYTWGEPDEVKKNTHPENITALFCHQVFQSYSIGSVLVLAVACARGEVGQVTR